MGLSKGWLVLILSLSGLTWWAWEVSYEEIPDHGKVQLRSPVEGWSELELRSINEISLRRKGTDDMMFKKDEYGYWWIVQPKLHMADQVDVQSWIGYATKPKAERVFSAPSAYEDQEAKTAIQLELKSIHGRRLCVNYFTMPSHEHHYFLHYTTDKNEIYKILTEHPLDLSKHWQEYRSRRIFPFSLSYVKEINYECAGESLRLLQDEAGNWSAEKSLSPHWQSMKEAWDSAACERYREKPSQMGERIASCRYLFFSGQKAHSELFHHEQLGYILQYIVEAGPALEEVLLISPETRDCFFPPVSSLLEHP